MTAKHPANSGEPTTSDELASLLDLVENEVRTHCVLPTEHAYVAATLWIVLSHVIGDVDIAPMLVITSVTKRCGKTRLLDVVGSLARDPLKTVNMSPAVFYRVLDKKGGRTILIDEADGVFSTGSQKFEHLRTLVNSAHLRGQKAYRMGGRGFSEVHEFETFAMVCLAGIGSMPDTIEDRAVVIRMERAGLADTSVKPFRYADSQRLLPQAKELSRWAEEWGHLLSRAEFVNPLQSRAADVWEPILALAAVAGTSWSQRARRAAVAFDDERRARDNALDPSERLLADTRRCLLDRDRCRGFIAVTEMHAMLVEDPECEWADAGLTPNRLSRMLRGFGLVSQRNTTGTLRGYAVSEILAVSERYLGSDGSDVSDTEAEVER